MDASKTKYIDYRSATPEVLAGLADLPELRDVVGRVAE